MARPLAKSRFRGLMSAEYDAFRKIIAHNERLHDLLVAHAALELKKRGIRRPVIVELGCGTGATTVRILKRIPRGTVIAIDNEPLMIQQCRKATRAFKRRVRFMPMDAVRALKSLPKESADAVVTAFTIHNLPPAYRKRLFPLIARVLKPGGIFANDDKYAPDNPAVYRNTYRWFLKRLEKVRKAGRPDWYVKWRAHYEGDDKIKFTEREQRGYFEANGFSRVQRLARWRMEAIFSAQKNE